MIRRNLIRLVRALSSDASLVSLPPNVQRCEVFRNVVSLDEEGLIYAELSRVLQRDGQTTALTGSTPEDRITKHVYLEMFGREKEFTEVKSLQKKEIRYLPGLLWSPTLLRVVDDVAPPLIGAVVDTARVVEHQLPGYEMHIEHPTVGTAFLYLNLLSDTVLDFDDESTGRRGQVLLPSRALMCVSGEARWGFRFGEKSENAHTFVTPGGTRRQIETDTRLSVQVWRLCPDLLDGRILQERLEERMDLVSRQLGEEVAKRVQVEKNHEEVTTALLPPVLQAPSPTVSLHPQRPLDSFLAEAAEKVPGKGVLGGDLAQTDSGLTSGSVGAKKNMGDVRQDYMQYKQEFSNVYGILQEMKVLQDSGQPINDLWLKKKMTESSSVGTEKGNENGFDPSNIEGTWDNVDAKARFYKAKLKTMDYDGTAFLNSRMPDISQDAPLDMRTTIRKIAPHVRDGEKILSSLPHTS